jgi:hypothetical protein
MKNKISLTFSMLLFVGCMPTVQDREQQAPLGPQQIESFDLLAEDYFVEDLACQDGEGLGEIGEQDVHRFDAGTTAPETHSFQGFTSKDTLQGPGFSQSIFDFHQQNKCKITDSSESCSSGSRVVKAPKQLKICDGQRNFARASVEGVALSGMSSLASAYKFYLSIPNARESLRDATLIVLPIVEKVTTQTQADGTEATARSITTDNLAYTPNFDGRPAFVIFPKSRNAVKSGRWKNLNLWELPWGMTHEFGHHVFRSHSGIDKLPGTTTNLHGLTFTTPIHSINFDETEVQSEQPANGFSLAGRVSGPEEIFSAVNEAYADLFSFYALGQSSNLVQGVDCFDKNRETTSSEFANGAVKRISTETMGLFNASERYKFNSCDGPDFQDAHSMGAVIAHGMMRLYKARADVYNATAGQQAGWLLTWADAVGSSIRSKGRAAVTFSSMLGLGIKGVAESDGSLTQAQCDIINEVFPALADDWFAADFSCR